MFKGILPSRRVPSADFTIITNLVDGSGKENQPNLPSQPHIPATKARSVSKGFLQMNEKKKRPDYKRSKSGVVPDTPMSGEDFDKLLDDLQIPSTLRPKLYGMDASVKAAMMKSAQNMALNPPLSDSPPATPQSSRMRKAHSTDSMNSPRHQTLGSLSNDTSEMLYSGLVLPQVSAHQSPYLSSPQRKAGTSHSRALSFDPPRFFSKSQVNLAGSSTLDLALGNRTTKEKAAVSNKVLSPTKLCSILTSTSSTQLDIEDIKKLRLLLRNETASWSEEFLKLGGYNALLTRLNEILEVEWREEQHDDQVLHELLRCFKALSTSSIGCFALRSSCPTPFVQLMTLLYSDKKPGEIATRQLIVELLLILFDLYPPSALPAGHKITNNGSFLVPGSSRQREAWQSQSSLVSSNLITLPAPHKNLFSLIRALLLTPAPPPTESPGAPVSPHAFIESLHLPRIYKTYLKELSDVCRDYFWVFCHPTNTIWLLSETNENSAEKPRAPGGMTGGVESEAMSYLTSHLKFINAIAKSVEALNMPKENENSAYRFHMDLFLSGFERILLISCRASTTHYPTLHLELARYIAYTARAGYELPYTVVRLIGLPPPGHAKPQSLPPPARPSTPTRSGRSTPIRQPTTPVRQPMTPSRRGDAPVLPSPRKVEPIKFD